MPETAATYGQGRWSLAGSVLLLVTQLCLFCGCGDGGTAQIVPPNDGLLPLVITQTAAAVEVSTPAGEITVRVQKEPFQLEYARAGDESVSEPAQSMFYATASERVYLDRVESVAAAGHRAVFSLSSSAGPASLELSFLSVGVARTVLTPPPEAGATSAGMAFRSPSEEAIYGLVERINSNPVFNEYLPPKTGSLNRRGTVVIMAMLYSVALYSPFFQTSRGYGVFVEGTAPGLYDLAATDPAKIAFGFQLPPGVKSLSYLFINGPSHDRLLDRYTAVAGRPFVPPSWAFKHWRWRDEHRKAEPVLLDGVLLNADFVDDLVHYEQLGIPVGNYTFDRPWGTGDLDDLTEPEEPGFGDLIWDEERFPNPQAMVDALSRRGYHAFLWIGPWATGKTTNREALEHGFLAPNSRYIVDYTNPAAVAWWSDKITPLLEMGFAGLKLDRGDEDTPWKPTDVYWDGRAGNEVRNAYPEIFARVHHDIVRRVRGEDFLVYPRSGYAGSQRWAVFSAGDIPGTDILGRPTDLGLRSAILAVQHCAFIGFPIWGSDTGGYEQFGDREVFARWLEFSAFCPIMEIGGTGTHAPWDMPTTPNYDTEMIDIYRHYTIMHHNLVPYIYRHALESGRTGRPVSKPLVFNYADDPRVRDMWEEFLLGDDILVAPVWQVGQRTQHVYLPAGRWVDYWNRARVVEGPADLDEPAPLDRIPIFVREGAEVLGTF